MVRGLLVSVLIFSASAAIVDRIAITVGQQVITEQELDEELRVAAFLNGEKINRTPEARRAAGDHLIQQLLVKREMEVSHYPTPAKEDVDRYLDDLRANFAGPEPFLRALRQYDLSEAALREHLALQLTTLRFIEFRFRPDVAISDSDIQSAYDREIAEWQTDHPGAAPPPLAASKEALRNKLLESRTDEALNAWLEESRKQVNIIYLDRALR